jgi:peptide/nickel transport system ATP-binding protein
VENKKPLIRIEHLTHYFPLKKKSIFQRQQLYVRANEDISLNIYEGETFGLVGESGCGKSTLGRVILQLYTQTSGTILYYGKTLEEFKPKYVKKTINRLPKIVARYNEMAAELGDNFEEKAKENKRIRKVVVRYADAVRIAGGLILADDLNEVSRVLREEYDAGSAYFTLTHKLGDVTLKRDTLVAKEAKSDADQKTLDQLNSEITVLTAQKDTLKATLDEKLAALQALREHVSSKEGFAQVDAKQDEGIDLAQLTGEEMRVLRRELQVIFQDPYSSLNPRLTVGQLISEALTAHNIFKRGTEILEKYVLDLMEKCGLQHYMLHRYPHQFSGGQRQRIGIARALAVMPQFVVCDEAVSALDVSIQSQIINLLIDLKEQEKLTYLFISHDLSTVKFISDRIGVMYLGSLVELTSSDVIFKDPLHPYTEALMEAIPTTEDESKKDLVTIEGDIPSPINPPSGCKFHTRCKYATEKCKNVVPEWRELKPGHFVACHYPLDRGEILVQKTKGASA